MLENGKLATLSIRDILPNRFQPRIHFDEQKLNELAESISKYGLIQPIVVRQIGNKYEIVAGERRYKASILASKESVPAIIVTLSDRDCEEIALLENIQREDLTPIEEAVSYKRILDIGYISQEELAKKIGKSQVAILNKMRLLNLDDAVQDALLHGEISERHARSLLKIKNREKQIEMLKRIINERLTVKMTDREINALLEGEKAEIETLSTSDRPVRRAVPVASHRIIKVNPPEELMNKINKKKEERVDTMDIDKILEEAQDITPNEEAKPEADMESLMTQNPNTVTSPIITNEEPIVPATEPAIEPGKFVTPVASEAPVQASDGVPTSNVTFDAVFNANPGSVEATSGAQVATEAQPVIGEAMPQNSVNTEAQPPVSAAQPVVSEPVMSTPVENNIVSEVPTDNPETANSLSSEVTSDVAADNFSNAAWPSGELNLGAETPAVPVMEQQSALVSETPVVDNVQPVAPVPALTPVSEPLAEAPAVFGPAAPMPAEAPINSSQPAPAVEPPVLPQVEQPIAEIPAVEPPAVFGPSAPVMPAEAPVNPSQPVAPMMEPPAAQPVYGPQPVNEIPNPLPEVKLDAIPTVEAPAFEQPQVQPVEQTASPMPPMTDLPGIPGAQPKVEEPSVGMNIPDDSILEENPNVQTPEQINTTLESSAKFRQVINIIRNSVSEIENLGFYIDTDEIDLGDKYQVTFKIDKQ